MGGLYYPPLRTLLISDCVLQDTQKMFCQFYQNYLKLDYWLKVFIFQMSEMWFSWQPKGECTPPVNSKVFFSDLLAPASRFNTLHGLENWHVQSSRHFKIMKNVLRHVRQFWRIYVLQFLATASVIKFVETFDFHIEYVL